MHTYVMQNLDPIIIKPQINYEKTNCYMYLGVYYIHVLYLYN